MCLSPIIVSNPWYCPNNPKQRDIFESRYPYWFLHNTTSPTMRLPCGLCAECLQARQNEFVQRCYEMSKFNYVLFGTLTYGDWALPRILVNGRSLKVCDIRDFQLFIKRLRKSKILPDFRYLCVTEYGDDKFEDGKLVHKSKHRPHFHFLLFVPYQYLGANNSPDMSKGYEFAQKVLDFIVGECGWKRNYCDNFSPLYIPLSSFIRRLNSFTYDCQFVPNSVDRSVVYYVTKYVLKFSDYVKRLQQALKLNLSSEDYYKVWYYVRPKVLCSKGLGIKLVQDSDWPCDEIDDKIDRDITEQIEFSSVSENMPQIYIDNKPFPLCKYYRDRLLTLENRIKFHNNQFELGPFEDEFIEEDVSLDDYVTDSINKLSKQQKFENLQKKLLDNQY